MEFRFQPVTSITSALLVLVIVWVPSVSVMPLSTPITCSAAAAVSVTVSLIGSPTLATAWPSKPFSTR
jgi:uncharacterized membrane protein